MSEYDGVEGALGSLMYLKQKHPYLRVLLSIGGASSKEVFRRVASDLMLCKNFARSAHILIEASDLDGVDELTVDPPVVWEYPCNEQRGCDFLQLLAATRMYLSENEYLITAALPANMQVLQYINLGVAARYLDFINLMAYDFFGCSW